ncbi:MAG: MarR family winged helix-turn-helix transcriptional regulator [Defluviitaleaceae bacterium]|nr:MarR family winged helix-turn-helix transcriptional regulator [Defluviitaleaceae bacterium]
MDRKLQKMATERLREIWRKYNAIHALYSKSVGISIVASAVLECLSEPDATYTQKGLCDKLLLPKQLVNTTIKGFWEQGLIELTEARDRRNKVIVLTAAGRAYCKKVITPIQDADFAVWDEFTEDEIHTFIRLSEKHETAFETAVMEVVNRSN